MCRNFLTTALLIALAALALTSAACGGGDADDPDTVVVGPDEPVRIRSLLSGDGASRYAIELAVADYGPVRGHEVELGPLVDSMCSPEGGRAAARQIIADPQVLGVVGTSCSASAVAASPILSVSGLVMISPSNTSPALTSDLQGNAGQHNYEGYFRVVNNDLFQARAVAGFAYGELGLRRIVTVHDGDPYTAGLATAFRNEFRTLGGAVPLVGVVEKGQTDMRDLLLEFANEGPDGIFFPIFTEEAEHFIVQARGVSRLHGAALITADAAFSPEFLALPESVGVYFAGPHSYYWDSVNTATGKTTREAHDAFEAEHGEPESLYWAHAYDATTLLLAAIERAAVPDDGNFFTRLLGIDARGTLRVERSALREAVWTVSSGFTGLTGTLACSEFGDCARGAQAIYHHTEAAEEGPEDLPVVYRFEP